MNRYLRRLEKYDIFCDRYMTEIKGPTGTYGVKGYRILNTKQPYWVRYDGSIWPVGRIEDIIEEYGKLTKNSKIKM